MIWAVTPPMPRSLALTPCNLCTSAQVRFLSSLGPCGEGCVNAIAAIRALAALPPGRRALLAAGAEAAVRAAAAAAAAAAVTAAATGGAHSGEAQTNGGGFQELARAALQALTSPPGARLPGSPAQVASTLAVVPPKCWACGAAAPPGGGPLQKCTGCGGPERWCSKECQRASWAAGHREVCKARRAGGGR
jgi:hypothetical protein